MHKISKMLAQFLVEKTTDSEARAVEMGSPVQESGGTRDGGGGVSGGSWQKETGTTRILQTGMQQARRSRNPVGIFQGFGVEEEYAPVEDVSTWHCKGLSQGA